MPAASSEAEKRNKQLIVDAVNHVTELSCPSCGHGLGTPPKVWECKDELHNSTNGYINATARALGATRCVKCGVISIRPQDEMVREPGDMASGEDTEMDMCYRCWHTCRFDPR